MGKKLVHSTSVLEGQQNQVALTDIHLEGEQLSEIKDLSQCKQAWVYSGSSFRLLPHWFIVTQHKVTYCSTCVFISNLCTPRLVKPAHISYRELSLRIVTSTNVPLLKQLPPMFWLIKYIQGF